MKTKNNILLANIAVLGMVVLSAFVIGKAIYQMLTF